MLKKLLLIFTFAASTFTHTAEITFNLVSPTGAVTEKDYAGKYLLMAVGYTSCPDICPTTLFEFGKAIKAIDNPDAIQMLFVTIDPINDEISRLNSYTNYFDPRIIGLTGEMKDIQSFASQVGAAFGYRLNGKKIDNPQFGVSYTVYHSALIYLISPEREIVDIFDYQIGEKGLIDALNKALPKNETPKAAAETPQEMPAEEKIKNTIALSCALPEGFEAVKKPTLLKDFIADATTDKPLLLNLWALWCAPCRKELPLFDQYDGTDFSVETLNLGDAPEKITELFNELSIKNLNPRTTNKDVLGHLNAVGLPFSALFVDGKQIASKAGLISDVEMAALAKFSRCQNAPSKP